MKNLSIYKILYLILGIAACSLASCTVSYQKISLCGNSRLGEDDDKNNPHANRVNAVVKLSNMPWHSFDSERESTK